MLIKRCITLYVVLSLMLPAVLSTCNFIFLFFSFFFDRGFGSTPEKAPFRDAYSKIGNVRGFTRAPLLCLHVTATAAKKTRKQIIKTLFMKNVLFISKPPDKHNIKMSVQKRSQEEELETTFSWVTEELKTRGRICSGNWVGRTRWKEKPPYIVL